MEIAYGISIFVVTEIHHSRTEYVLITLVYPLLIAATTLHPKSWTTRFLELAPLRFVGRISYSLYLWQEIFFDPFAPAPAPPHSFRSQVLLCWIATFGCATASYYLIETPLIRYGHELARKFDARELEETQVLVSAETAGAQ